MLVDPFSSQMLASCRSPPTLPGGSTMQARVGQSRAGRRGRKHCEGGLLWPSKHRLSPSSGRWICVLPLNKVVSLVHQFNTSMKSTITRPATREQSATRGSSRSAVQSRRPLRPKVGCPLHPRLPKPIYPLCQCPGPTVGTVASQIRSHQSYSLLRNSGVYCSKAHPAQLSATLSVRLCGSDKEFAVSGYANLAGSHVS